MELAKIIAKVFLVIILLTSCTYVDVIVCGDVDIELEAFTKE